MSNGFDKFMDDICKREDVSKKRVKTLSEEQEESPQRKYNRLYRERPQNKTVWRKK